MPRDLLPPAPPPATVTTLLVHSDHSGLSEWNLNIVTCSELSGDSSYSNPDGRCLLSIPKQENDKVRNKNEIATHKLICRQPRALCCAREAFAASLTPDIVGLQGALGPPGPLQSLSHCCLPAVRPQPPPPPTHTHTAMETPPGTL